MNNKFSFLLFFISSFLNICIAQNVTIDNYSVNAQGQAQLSIQAQESKYYILHAQHSPTFNWATSITIGVDGTMAISEPLGAYPLEKYSITEHDITNPDDYDGDGIDDITELNNMPTDAPFNFASPIAIVDGATSIPDAETFMSLATVNNVGWAPFLDDQLYVKFGILDRDTDEPKVYFINSNTYTIHASFWSGIGASVNGDDGSGEIVFNPNEILPSGVVGSYSFNFSFGDAYSFEDSQRTFELLSASMPFLQNNMNHFIGQSSENNYLNNYAEDFEGSRIEVVLETDVFAEINYVPFHEAEGYGFFRHVEDLNETPGSRDIVLYDALPNSLPRVGGIITSVMQTPLSHVNLRAIQDNVPNAYIADPLSSVAISSLLGNYIYYKTESDEFEIREASLDEVNDWYEDLRPSEPQIPVRDLSITQIMPLDNIEFEMSSAFGAKCSNLATMRTFELPEGTIPDGFGIPFFYYDEFMQFNNFYQEAQTIIENPTFHNDINFRVDRLKLFREDIKAAPMPDWMLDELQAMHDSFPEGTNVRCRSSTNNEDLPGFSGAGLYTSKTQYVDEGHISKSIKQIYASMWNFRAYEERDFYRVDHFMAAMGVLCHPNFQDEQSNGVGISIDPIYETENTFYLNTQVGESLITNPDANSVPEEILLYEDPNQGGGYLVLRLSNLVNPGELVMDIEYLDLMRDHLSIIHEEFADLYDVVGAEGFAMDIEYKITEQGQLIIKQARPWVSFWAGINADNDLGLSAFVAPQSSSSLNEEELITVSVANQGLNSMSNFDLDLTIDGQLMETMTISETIEPFSQSNFQFTLPQDFSAIGDYNLTSKVSHINDEYDGNDSLSVVVSKIYPLNAGLSISQLEVICYDKIEAEVILSNHGDEVITEIELEAIINNLQAAVFSIDVDILPQQENLITITIDENLQESNDITLNLLSVNGQLDADLTNNSETQTTALESEYDVITLIINADDYPEETSWKLLDESNEIVSSGSLDNNTEVYSEDICVNYSSCFSLYVYDSYGDGICCGYGEGDFLVLDASGNIVLANQGEFDNFVQEVFCLDEIGCEITADLNVINVSSTESNDGAITININSGLGPFQYSIDNGQNFQDTNTFNNLAPGNYEVFVQGASDVCSYQQMAVVETCNFNSAEILALNASSVVSTDGSIIITPTSGQGPYLYSIDGGQNYETSNVFSGLPVGTYNVVVKDELEVCLYEASVPVRVESIVINEINYSSTDTFSPDDWIELYNPEPFSVDVSNWKIKDDNDSHVFVIPQETQIEPGGYLIIVKNESSFASIFPGIYYVGELGFGLGTSDEVRLYTSEDKLVDQVNYKSEAPWPTCAYETGNSLELISPELENSLAENWSCINENGSPNNANSIELSNEPPSRETVKLYPNPVENTLYVVGNSAVYDVEVYSILGQSLLKLINVSQVDMSLFNKGVYLLKISNDNTTNIKRVVKH
jgi:hypothetical protein